jgi:HD-like signal output (HDOD) protein
MTQDTLDNWLNVEEGRRREKVLRRVSEVCAVPATAQRVLALASDQNADVKQLSEAAASDPAIAAQLLRIANSPLYAHSRQIVDLKRAIVLIGRKELHSMAAAMAMLAAVKSDTPLARRLNNSSVLSATLARMTAKHLDRKLDDAMAFLSGLLCEIGALACLSIDGDGYTKIFEEANGALEMMTVLEKQRYGASSEEIGADMLRRNLLPDLVVKAVRTSLDDDIDSLELLQRITLFARMAAPVIVNGAEEEESSVIADHCHVLLENLRVGEIPKDILLDMCIVAATAAELRLRGKPVD